MSRQGWQSRAQQIPTTNTLLITKPYHTSVPATKAPSEQAAGRCEARPGWLKWNWVWLAKANTDKCRERRHNSRVLSCSVALGRHIIPSGTWAVSAPTARRWRDTRLLSGHFIRLQHPKVSTFKAKQSPKTLVCNHFFSVPNQELMPLFIYLHICEYREKN